MCSLRCTNRARAASATATGRAVADLSRGPRRASLRNRTTGPRRLAKRRHSLSPAVAARIRPAARRGELVALAAVVSLAALAIALHPSTGSPARIRTWIGDVGRRPLASGLRWCGEISVENPASPRTRRVLAEVVAIVAVALLALASTISTRQLHATGTARAGGACRRRGGHDGAGRGAIQIALAGPLPARHRRPTGARLPVRAGAVHAIAAGPEAAAQPVADALRAKKGARGRGHAHQAAGAVAVEVARGAAAATLLALLGLRLHRGARQAVRDLRVVHAPREAAARRRARERGTPRAGVARAALVTRARAARAWALHIGPHLAGAAQSPHHCNGSHAHK
mmetsp:Transcript_19872/g.52719  ORF Transcript_19872/g.52719 Transcript_19872/m.52719 type:complete len:341 (-) Transcript_19872:120-1142(-)